MELKSRKSPELGHLVCSQETVATWFLVYIRELCLGKGAVKMTATIHLFCSCRGEISWEPTGKSLSAVKRARSGHEEPSKELASVLPLAGNAAKDGCVCPGVHPNANYTDEDVQSE